MQLGLPGSELDKGNGALIARDGKRESRGLCVASQESLSQVGLLGLSEKSIMGFLGPP